MSGFSYSNYGLEICHVGQTPDVLPCDVEVPVGNVAVHAVSAAVDGDVAEPLLLIVPDRDNAAVGDDLEKSGLTVVGRRMYAHVSLFPTQLEPSSGDIRLQRTEEPATGS